MRTSEAWDRIEVWLGEHAPPLLASLAPGASEEDLHQLEILLGQPLPTDFRASYSRHNGQLLHPIVESSPRFIYGDELYPIQKICRRWEGLAALEVEPNNHDVIPVGAVQPRKNSSLRVPIAGDDGSHYYFLDLCPAMDGNVGQVILSYHDERTITRVASSFTHWLWTFAEELEDGAYVYSERYRGIVLADR